MANTGRDRDRQNYRGDRGGRETGSDYRSSEESGYRDRDEGYFGSGRMQHGSGYSSGARRRDYEDDMAGFNRPSRAYTGGYGDDTASDYNEREGDYYRRSDPNTSSSRPEGPRSEYGRFSGWPNPSRSLYERTGFTGYGDESAERYRSDDPSSGRGNDERGWWDKTSDEVASWFGDDEAARRRETDERSEGGHRGRGPKNYTRSDDRIKEDVSDRLMDSSYVNASEIEVVVDGGDVTLSGTVESRNEKRIAEDIAENVSGVKNVENRVRVVRRESYADTGLSPTVKAAEPAGATDNTETTRSKSASQK